MTQVSFFGLKCQFDPENRRKLFVKVEFNVLPDVYHFVFNRENKHRKYHNRQ